MNSISVIISQLKEFNLSNISDEEVIQLLQKTGKLLYSGYKVEAGQLVLRSVSDKEFVNRKNEERISYIKDKSIVPEYNRASLKGNSIFYGCIPTFHTPDENYCQALSIAEVSKIHENDIIDKQEEYITMGKWRVIKGFTAVAIAYHQEYINNNKELSIFRVTVVDGP